MSQHTFPELGIAPELLEAVKSLGFEQPSPIQAEAIPVALTGRDVVGQSQTGSGKTMAFGIPVVQRVDATQRNVQALILCPTRELAMQVCAEIHKLATFKDIRATPVYGGASYDRQIRALQSGSQIVVGTPGRILDFMERGLIKLDGLKMLVFDEADEMLDMGFSDDIDRLMAAVPKERQTIFFSATFEPRIRRLVQNYTRDAATITIQQKALTVPTVEQRYYEVHGRSKTEVLCRVLDIEAPRLTIVFANTKRAVDDATDALVARGYAADRLHGDINQTMRERVMRNFRSGAVEVLCATDVAARGLDVNDIDLIVNLELPYDAEDYVHRIGRTGRAGRSGKAVSLVAGREIYLMQRIQRFINIRIDRASVPSQEDLEATRVDKTFEKVKGVLEASSFTSHEHSIQRLLDAGFTATEIASALMDLLMKDQVREAEQIMEDRAPKRKDAPQREFQARPAPPVRTPAPVPAAAPAPKPAPVEAAPAPAADGEAPAVTESPAPEAPAAVETAAVEASAPAISPVPSASPAPAEEHEEDAGPTNHQAAAPAPAASPRPAPAKFDNEYDTSDEERPLPKKQSSYVQKGPRSGMVRLFINVGGMDQVRPQDIAGMLYNTIQDLTPGSIGAIDVLEKCSFVEVPGDVVESVLEGVKGAQLRGRDVRMDHADRPDDISGIRPKRFGGGGGFIKKPGFGGGYKGGSGGGFSKGGYGGGGGGYQGGGGGFKKPGFGGAGGGFSGGGFKKPGFGSKPWQQREGEGPSPGYGGGDDGPRREDAGSGYQGGGEGGGGYGGPPKRPFGGGGGGKRFGGGGGGFKKKW
ncbi:DEAD/DEAH box helicase [Prosthecobacter sp.]|uniref:DEAD/DEAH box helicase n=1 Tax=Prosthecobacter sp. TaxID=1965333 RepID=UPI002AB89015|nr:DEAD/DEAH box helicase [Prosthecobacter sp.]MDZ4406320.1 DEAD/DEAH box helicase [Prosthecobacter sp.]